MQKVSCSRYPEIIKEQILNSRNSKDEVLKLKIKNGFSKIKAVGGSHIIIGVLPLNPKLFSVSSMFEEL